MRPSQKWNEKIVIFVATISRSLTIKMLFCFGNSSTPPEKFFPEKKPAVVPNTKEAWRKASKEVALWDFCLSL